MSMKRILIFFFFYTFQEDGDVYFLRLYNYFSLLFIFISGRQQFIFAGNINGNAFANICTLHMLLKHIGEIHKEHTTYHSVTVYYFLLMQIDNLNDNLTRICIHFLLQVSKIIKNTFERYFNT